MENFVCFHTKNVDFCHKAQISQKIINHKFETFAQKNTLFSCKITKSVRLGPKCRKEGGRTSPTKKKKQKKTDKKTGTQNKNIYTE